MKLNVKAVNFEIADRLAKHIEKKTKRYEKLLPESAEMEIQLTVVKPETNDCLEAIEKQLEKRKDK